MQTLAVTGGIGSGKSLVCMILAERGFPVYDSDTMTKALYDEDPVLLEAVRQKMLPYSGREAGDMSGFLLDKYGRLDRKALSRIVFPSGVPDTVALRELESVVHPAVLRDFLHWKDSDETAAAARFGTVVIESAIIMDIPMFREAVDMVLLVDAPLETRIRRAMARDGADRESVEARIRSQKCSSFDASGDSGLPDVDFLIENSGTEDDLRYKVEQFIDLNYNNRK